MIHVSNSPFPQILQALQPDLPTQASVQAPVTQRFVEASHSFSESLWMLRGGLGFRVWDAGLARALQIFCSHQQIQEFQWSQGRYDLGCLNSCCIGIRRLAASVCSFVGRLRWNLHWSGAGAAGSAGVAGASTQRLDSR